MSMTTDTRPALMPEGGKKQRMFIYHPRLTIDFWPGWMTETEYLNLKGDEDGRAVDLPEYYLTKHRAFSAAYKLRWHGDVRGEVLIAGLPMRDFGVGCAIMIAWKQDNGGETFIASPVELPWLLKEDEFGYSTDVIECECVASTLKEITGHLLVYEIPPIDYWAGWMTEAAYFESLASYAPADAAYRMAEYYLTKQRAFATASKMNWEGDGGDWPMIAALPRDGDDSIVLAWKQSNNGTTYVASPVELPWLEGNDVLEAAP